MSELQDQIKQIVEGEDVALFMKGTPQFVMCGNSDRALQALRRAGASVTAVDVLPDPQIRQELSAISGWPTIPQVFVKGELVGGADIVEELEQTGDLAEPVCLPAQLLFLPGEGLLPPLQVGPAALVLGQRDDVAQVGLGQALQLLGQAGPPAAQAVPP